MDVIIINISGRRFEINQEIMTKLPDRAMHRYLQHPTIQFKGGRREYFFERHAEVFESVLYFYQTGKLHMPLGVCPTLFKTELDFWGLDVRCLENCCLDTYSEAYKNKCRLDKFEAYYRDNPQKCIDELRKTKWYCFRNRVWVFLDNPFASRATKIYYWISIAFICLAIIALALGTSKEFQTVVNASKWAENYVLHHHFPWAATGKGEVNATNAHVDVDTLVGGGGGSSDGGFGGTNSSHWDISEGNFTETKGFSYKFIHRVPVIGYLEFFCQIFFTLETAVKLVFCPKLKLYFTSLLNLVDLSAVISYHAWVIVSIFIFYGRPVGRIGEIIEGIAVLRVFRLLRLAKHVRGLRVLLYTIKSNLPEVLLFYLMLFVASILFGSLMYYLDAKKEIADIPDAMWWAIITLTTIGYGDITPETVPGKLLGSFCAVTGLLIVAVSVPIFVTKFMLFYNHVDRDSFSDNLHDDTHAHINVTARAASSFNSPFNRKLFSRRSIRKINVSVNTMSTRRIRKVISVMKGKL